MVDDDMVNAPLRPAAFNAWEAFVASAERGRDAPALIFPHRTVSFTELKMLALRAAAFLASRGVRRGDVVMLQLPKRVETYALILAALRLGAAHCCIDPKNPALRSERMINRVQPRLFFTMTDAINPYGETLYTPLSGADLGLERGWPAPLATFPDFSVNGVEPAYVMFTSGSTGEPKGGVVPHQGVLSLMSHYRDLIGEPLNHRFTAINPLHFDNMVFDTYCGLINGSAIVPVETSEFTTPQQWTDMLTSAKATVFYAVPTLYQMLDDVGLLTPETFPDAKFMIFAGEGFPIERLRRFFARFKDRATLTNAYGPTEASCLCTEQVITEEELAHTDAPFPAIGYVFKNYDYAVLDDSGRPVAPGVPGEFYIGGPALALGYFNNPEQTQLRFVQDPRQSRYRAIFYRTGDLVREDADGKIWFIGRVDNQVKFGSYRVELEEIDHAVQSIDGVRRAVCVVQKTDVGDELCVAFSASRPFSKREIVEGCRASLPTYMLPSQVLQLEELPRNANDKVDRLAVRKLFADLFGGVAPAPAPAAPVVEAPVVAAAPEPAPQPAPAPVVEAPAVAPVKLEVVEAPQAPIAIEADNEVEAALAEIWGDILGLPEVGRGDNFFDLGGTSLLLRRAHTAIQARFEKNVPIVALFENPTIASLAVYLLQGGATSAALNSAKARAERQAEALRRLRDTRG